MIGFLLFSSYFSIRLWFARKKYWVCGYAISYIINSIDSSLAVPTYSLMTISLSPNFGTVARSSYQEKM
jgi:hypothetical protein